MQNIYLIRHGETQWNKNRRFQGSKDIELNEIGRQQALKLQNVMKNIALDRIVSSDLKRAKQTAMILNQPHNLSVDLDAGFREVNFGLWEGLNFQEVQDKYPNEAKIWQSDPVSLIIPEGETFFQLTERVWQRFIYWTKKNDYKNMVIVCHGGTSAAIICAVLGEPISCMWQYVQPNTAVNHIEYNNGEYFLKGLNVFN